MKAVESILVLVNPTAASHSGHHLWAHLIPRFQALFAGYEHRIVETRSAEHNVELGATADTDLIISVGGDGTVHDIAQGIMQRPRSERPMLTMFPIGSGNDFARSLGIPLNPRRALETLSLGVRATIDVGRCNETFFLETLSFGVDAAIALKTIEMRARSKNSGPFLYARAAISAILHELKAHHIVITAQDAETSEGGGATDMTIDANMIICAIQNGPTYGEGFRIAPNAHLNDGILNICTATTMNRLYALYALMLLARGRHEKLSFIRALTAQRLSINLDQEIPVQCDGEALHGTHFDVELLSGALDVLLPRSTTL
jgi:YegS/Rv2252/BmrU family lipid kinase